ncbi:MAG: hypothetical protein IPP90_06935 [Gemmatimonadaceae bacterium]|nr:hypothetical protein [Gemmatimonadaceae bacterium]
MGPSSPFSSPLLEIRMSFKAARRYALMLVALTVAACGGGGGDGGTALTPAIALSISSSTLTAIAGASTEITATISRTGGFTGAVTLDAQGLPAGITASVVPSPVGAAGTTATVTLSTTVSVPPGSYLFTIRASASGVSERTASATIVITARPSVALALASTTVSVQAGSSGRVIAQLTRVNFSEAVTLSLEGAPSGVTAGFGTPTLSGDTTSLTLSAAFSASPGTYPMVVRARSSLADQTASLTLTVLPPPDFTVSMTPSTLSVRQVASGISLARIVRTGGFTGAVALTVEGLPAGVSGTFTQPTVSGDTTSLTLVAAAAAVPGTYALTVRGRASGLPDHTATLALTITPTGSVSLALSPSALSVEQGASKVSTVTITRTAPFTGGISLSVEGAPAGVTGVFSTPVIASGATTATLTLSIGGSVPLGPYSLVVRGTPTAGSGLTDQTAPLTLTVAAPTTSLTAQHLLAQEGLAIALASTVLQSQLQVLFAVTITGTNNSTPCEALVGGGSVQSLPVGQSDPRKVGIYYDTQCTRPYIIADVTQFVADNVAKRYDITEAATYFGPSGTTLGVLSLQETAVLNSSSDPYVAGLGTFTPANGAPPVRLGLTCTVPSSGSSLPCYGGVTQTVPSLARAIGSVTLLTLNVIDTDSPVTFAGNNSVLSVADPGALTLGLATATTLAISGGTAFGTSAQAGSAATFSLFPPTPTTWSVTDAAHDMKFELQVASNVVRNSTATITRISTGQVLATLALDQSGTGTVTWSDGSTAPVTSWMLGN